MNVDRAVVNSFFRFTQEIQSRVSQEYLREEHLSDFISDLLETLLNHYEGTSFCDAVFRYPFYFQVLLEI